jgi:hypothetical protein
MDPDGSPAQSSFDRRDLHATRMLDRLGEIGDERLRALTQRGLEIGLEAAPSVQDRRITTFARGGQPAFAGINLPQGAVRTLRRPLTKSTVLSTTCSRAAAFRS